MNSNESMVAEQVRLNQLALEIQECINRPKDMTVTKCGESYLLYYMANRLVPNR